METLSSAKRQAMIAWGRAGWENCKEYPYQDTRDEGQVLYDEHIRHTLNISFEEGKPRTKVQGFPCPWPQKGQCCGRERNLWDSTAFHGEVASGKLAYTIQLLHFL